VWLTICAPDDTSALWASEGLRRRGLEPLHLISCDFLALNIRWEHRLENGGIYTSMTLPDGLPIYSGNVRGVLNRFSTVPGSSLMLIHPSDRYYIASELQAFFLSWLTSLPAPVVNRPTPLGLAGQIRHASEWVLLATKSGLPNRGYRQSSQDPVLAWDTGMRLPGASGSVTTLVVVNGVVTGPAAPEAIREGCRRLSELSATPLLGVDFAVDGDANWTFAGVSVMPDLRLGGDALLDALVGTLNR
jgi:hypothetical protein